MTEFIGGEVINVSARSALYCSADEINLIAFNIFDYHDLFLRKEMKSQIADCFSQNTFLEKKNICTRGNNLFYQLQNVFLFFLKETIHRSVVMYNNVTLKVCFRCRKWELYDSNFSAFNASWTTGKMRGFFVNKN